MAAARESTMALSFDKTQLARRQKPIVLFELTNSLVLQINELLPKIFLVTFVLHRALCVQNEVRRWRTSHRNL